VNLAQIRSAQDISYTNKKPQPDGAKKKTFLSSLHVVITTGKEDKILTEK